MIRQPRVTNPAAQLSALLCWVIVGDHPWLFLSVFIVNDLIFGVEEKILKISLDMCALNHASLQKSFVEYGRRSTYTVLWFKMCMALICIAACCKSTKKGTWEPGSSVLKCLVGFLQDVSDMQQKLQ